MCRRILRVANNLIYYKIGTYQSRPSQRPAKKPPQPQKPSVAQSQTSAPPTKIAICIGILYLKTSLELAKCVEDAQRMRDVLTQRGYIVIMMTEEKSTPLNLQPTRENIIAQLNAITAREIFISYSGHGSQSVNRDGTEYDGLDETIIPMDFPRNRQMITDNILLAILRSKRNARIMFFSDSCHSGTLLDLRYNLTYKTAWTIDTGFATILADDPQIIIISSCMDSQVSYELRSGGVLTDFFVTSILRTPTLTFEQFVATSRSFENMQLATLAFSDRFDLKRGLFEPLVPA